jgi:hypothetical protein
MGGLEPPIQRRAKHGTLKEQMALDGRVRPGHGEFV